MNEFEALNYLYNDLRLMKCLDIVEEAKVKSAYECLQQALQELQAIKEAKPSEALEKIGNVDLGDNPYKTFDANKLKNVYNKEFNGIKQALLKQLSGSQYTNIFIDEVVKPSEALEALIRISIRCHSKVVWDDPIDFDLDTIKQALLKAEKLEKAWKIVKKKMVSIRLLYPCSLVQDYNGETHKGYSFAFGLPELTQQEFELLKEVLDNEKQIHNN